jgi:hypothetical protein
VKCCALNRLGAPCRAFAITGSEKCYLHSSKAKARRAGRAGGLRQGLVKRLKSMGVPRSVEEFTQIVAQTSTELRAGRCDSRVAHAIATLASTFIKAREVADLERRITALEAHDATVRSQREALRCR